MRFYPGNFGGLRLVVLATLALSSPGHPACQGVYQPTGLFAHAASFAEQQLSNAANRLNSQQHARSTLGSGLWNPVPPQNWVSGFFSGCQWLMFERTGQAKWRLRATQQTLDLAAQQFNTNDHDTGFRIFLSYGNAFRLTGDPAFQTVVLNAAQSLATRYDATVGCTRSWSFGNWQFPVIIDNMMNLELLFWAAQNGGNPYWHSMARSHALRSAQEHVRPDGSTYHVVDFDPVSGNALWKGTYQGFADASTWARGQAWAIYGFTMAFRYTQESALLDGAMRVADYWLKNLPADGVPYWDFAAPNIPGEPRDTSAAAIAAAGLLELCQYAPAPADRQRYRRAALLTLTSLSGAPYLAEGSNSEGILLHGVGNKPANSEIDVSLIYGDYYYLEALGRL